MTPTPSDELQSGEHRILPMGPSGTESSDLPRPPDRPSVTGAPNPAKMACEGANEPPAGASIPMEAADQPLARAESTAVRDTVGAMDIAVALEADARQAASVNLADEQALVRKAQAGDRLAFDELVRRYDRDVLRLALNLVHRSEDARDIYQESFLRVYRNLHRFRFECSFYTWLYRIVTNVGLDHLRRRTSRREDQAPVPDETEPGSSTRDFFDRQPEQRASANPEKRLLGQELGRQIEEAMGRLSPRERMVFELKHYQGLRLRAIGDLLGTSEETAKNSLFRATRKLRASLDAFR
jgi:RNA polymerase sigma-70 factor, ECF subfamily